MKTSIVLAGERGCSKAQSTRARYRGALKALVQMLDHGIDHLAVLADTDDAIGIARLETVDSSQRSNLREIPQPSGSFVLGSALDHDLERLRPRLCEQGSARQFEVARSGALG